MLALAAANASARAPPSAFEPIIDEILVAFMRRANTDDRGPGGQPTSEVKVLRLSPAPLISVAVHQALRTARIAAGADAAEARRLLAALHAGGGVGGGVGRRLDQSSARRILQVNLSGCSAAPAARNATGGHFGSGGARNDARVA